MICIMIVVVITMMTFHRLCREYERQHGDNIGLNCGNADLQTDKQTG